MKEKKKKAPKPQPGIVNFENGLKLWDDGKFKESIAEFDLAGAAGFRKDATENNIGASYERLGKHEEALSHYASALKINGGNFFALKNSAEILFSDGSWQESKKFFAKAVRSDPKDSSVRLDYIRCLMFTGDFARAIKNVVALFEESTDTKVLLDAVAILRDAEAFDEIIGLKALYPPELNDSAEFLKIIGEAYLEAGMTDLAIGSFNRALGKGGDAVTKSWLGLAEISQGSDARGMSLLKEAMEEDGDNLQVLRNMSFALHGKDNLEAALPIYERAVRLFPNEFVLWNNWGNALYNLHRYAESIPKFVSAIEKNPDYEIAWNNIGNALEKMKLHMESLPYHIRAIEINENFDYAHYAAAVALLMTGQRKEGLFELDTSLLSNPTFPEAWEMKARSLIWNAPDVGMTFALRAYELEPDSAKPLVTMSMCQFMLGRNADAEKNLRKARKLAQFNKDEKALNEIAKIEKGGPPAIFRILGSQGLAPEKGAEAKEVDTDSERALRLYKLASEELSKGKPRKSADLFSLAFELDSDSSATALALLRSERNKERLEKYIAKSRKIRSAGFATPALEKAIDEAEKKIGTASLDRSASSRKPEEGR